MKKIRVRTKSNNYNIYIGSGLYTSIGKWLLHLGLKHKAIIISNPILDKLYGSSIQQSLTEEGYRVTSIIVPDGEEQKSLETATAMYNRLAQAEVERNTPILALGGGVIGDLAGFVAATYLRGVPLIQVPTSLLAQVDSSIGGKVAVNQEMIKNKIGSFYQPILVVSDIECLKTLPETELVNGLAEVIKYAVIKDGKLFNYLEANIQRIKACESEILEEIIYKCALIKARIVSRDERDLGLRNILNFGHTIGHALESNSEFKLGHGAAVALGMLAAGRIAQRLDIFNKTELRRLKQIIANAGLPVTLPNIDIAKVMGAIKQDKKIMQGKIRFVLPEHIGKVRIIDSVELSQIEEVLTEKG